MIKMFSDLPDAYHETVKTEVCSLFVKLKCQKRCALTFVS